MFSNKLILQSLVTVPKKLQQYSVVTISNSKLICQPRLNLQCIPSEENKEKKVRKTLTAGIGRENEIFRNCSSFSILLDAYGRVRKVNHVANDITKTFHLDKTQLKHLQKSFTITNGNIILNRKLRALPAAVRFITNRSNVLPPPTKGGNAKTTDIPDNSDRKPECKVNVKFSSTIPPPTRPNETIRQNTKVTTPESTFTITMSKGRKIRPPSNPGKQSLCSNTLARKFNDLTLLQNRNNLQINFKFLIHTTSFRMSDEDKSKNILNVTNLVKLNEGNTSNDIYYEQHFPCPLDKKDRNFMKSYLRKINLPPPTQKRLQNSSNAELEPVNYSLDVKEDLITTAKEKKSTLMDLLEKTKSVVENDPAPALDLNLSTAGGLQVGYENSVNEDFKKSIVKMQGGTFTREEQYQNQGGNQGQGGGNQGGNQGQNQGGDQGERDTHSELVDIINEHKRTLDHDKVVFANNPPPEYNFQNTQYEDPHVKEMQEKNEQLTKNIEEQEIAVYTEYPEDSTEAPPHHHHHSGANTQNYSSYTPDNSKNTSNSDMVTANKSYKMAERDESNSSGGFSMFSNASLNTPESTNTSATSNTYTNMANMMSTMMSTVAPTSASTEPKYNFHAAAISNAASERSEEKSPPGMTNTYEPYKSPQYQENKFSFQGPYLNLLSSEANDMQQDKPIYTPPTPAEQESNEEYEKQMMKINYLAADMKNYGTMSSSSTSSNSEPGYGNNESESSMSKYFDSINRMDNNPSAYSNQNFMSPPPLMPTHMMPHQSMMPNSGMNMGQGIRPTKVQNTGKRIMNKLKSMKNSKGLAELAKSFNHSGMFIPKQNLWKKFKFPAPAPSYYEQNEDESAPSTSYDRTIPKFESFKEAREYFIQPDNLKKLTPAQIAMYNSILYYENVVKKHAEEIQRQKENLESTQKALKVRKNKLCKKNKD